MTSDVISIIDLLSIDDCMADPGRWKPSFDRAAAQIEQLDESEREKVVDDIEGVSYYFQALLHHLWEHLPPPQQSEIEES